MKEGKKKEILQKKGRKRIVKKVHHQKERETRKDLLNSKIGFKGPRRRTKMVNNPTVSIKKEER